ncbi:Cytoplasmic axial filament protein CafA and Ribonuclease G [Lachnospiraceae bacterium TWA4]|nr:Cytoplasmic axial filament protein CafA and Ribonuclease G [Lachnospiraceae bacterium TWA4]
MRKLSKQIITRVGGALVCAHSKDGSIVEISRLEEDLNSIVIGKVKNIVKNIHAAFVELGDHKIGYLSLDHIESLIFTTRARENEITIGDEIVVQIEKSAIKTKAPVLTGKLQLAGKHLVLLHGENGILFSHKIKDKEWMNNIHLDIDCGAIIRTSAYGHEDEMMEELHELYHCYEEIVQKSIYKSCYSILYKRPLIDDLNCEIVTDEKEIASQLEATFYEDSLLPLAKLYSLETVIEKALKPQVWLKSGGYLVIEPTEALTVIDVNTGKYLHKSKDKEETFLKINLEAAKEIAKQLQLRNLSGIVIVDFIDLRREESKKELLSYLANCIKEDSVKTNLIDMTKLNLVELTRKKIKKPLHEQFQLKDGKVISYD